MRSIGLYNAVIHVLGLAALALLIRPGSPIVVLEERVACIDTIRALQDRAEATTAGARERSPPAAVPVGQGVVEVECQAARAAAQSTRVVDGHQAQ